MNSKAAHQQKSKKPAPSEKAAGANGAIDESGNVDRIRNILFGSQMRDYDGRFQKLEERLVQEAAALRSDVQKRLDAIESFMKGEVESMTNRVRAENTERVNGFERMAREVAEVAKGLELKLRNLDEQTAKDIRDLRQQGLDQSKALSAEIKTAHDQLKGSLEHESDAIRQAMTGREALAEMLQEVALRLKNEFRVPGA
jgi:hypothetical protein